MTAITLKLLLNRIFSIAAYVMVFGNMVGSHAQPGDLDTMFGSGGTTAVSFGDRIASGLTMALQPDGKILVAGYADYGDGYFALVRYNRDGSPDTTFGTDGKTVTSIKEGSSAVARGIVLQDDGRILLAGNALKSGDSDYAVARYLANGALDTSFGFGQGKIVFGSSNIPGERAFDVAIDPGGNILVAGEGSGGFTLVRLLQNGMFDPSFSGGRVHADFDAPSCATAVAALTDGRIVLAGYVSTSGFRRLALARFLNGGQLDLGFGVAGKASIRAGIYDNGANSMIVLADGRILIGGYADNGTGRRFMLARLSVSGALDMTFGENGLVVTDIAGVESECADIALDEDSRIIAAGFFKRADDPRLQFAVARYSPQGILDATFGTGGKVTSDFNTAGRSVVVQHDGNILVAGEKNFIVARYIGYWTPDIAVEHPVGTPILHTDSVDFGNAKIGETAPVHTFVIRNSGSGTLKMLAITKDGANAGDFSVGSLSATELRQYETTTFTVTFTPSASGMREAILHVASNDADENPFDIVLRGSGVAPLIITSGTGLPSGVVGIAYNIALAADGGVAPYTWSIVNGSLPSGLSLDGGVIKGRPVAAVTSQFTVRVEDQSGASIFKDFVFVVIGQNVAGALDNSFGSGGKVVTAVGSSGGRVNATAMQHDGKILVAGGANNGSDYDFVLLRYNSDGTLDTTFGAQGQVTTSIGALHDYAFSVAVQPDSKIIVGGRSANDMDDDFALVRYNPNGTLDTTFGTGGKVVTSIGPNSAEVGWSLAIQPDGKILLGGFSDNGTVNDDFALVRYLPTGQIDAAFGNGGKVTTSIGSGDDHGYSIILQSDYKILMAGSSQTGTGSDFALARFNADGSLDATFGAGGKVTTPIKAADDGAWSAALHPDGKILLAGFTSYGGVDDYDIALARYLPNGTLDESFGEGGKIATDIAGGSDDSAHDVVVAGDGGIVVIGACNAGANYDFAVVCYLPDGSLDTRFGTGGKMVTAIGASDDLAWCGSVQNDGKIIVAGDSRIGGAYEFALVRYLGWPGSGFPPPQITTASPLPSGMVGVPYSVAFAATGGAPPLTWSIAAGSLPPGLNLSSAGGFSGTPESAGNYGFDVRVTAFNGLASTQTFALTIARAIQAGDLDTTFGEGGKVTTAIRAGDDYGYSVAVQADGKILVGGYSGTVNYDNFALVRYQPDGTVDTAFGEAGKVTTALGLTSSMGRSVAVQPDGKILLAGDYWNGGSLNFGMARYLPSGALDTAFGAAGKVENTFWSAGYCKTVLIQSDGRIVLAGEARGPGIDFGLLRFLPDGSVDATFGNGGQIMTDFGNALPFDYPQSAVLQPDDKILIAGYVSGTDGFEFALVRHLADGALVVRQRRQGDRFGS